MTRAVVFTLAVVTATAIHPSRSIAQSSTAPAYLRDRAGGIPTSMFATYVNRGELLVYPFFEYYRDKNFEYKPAELGYGLDQDFRGKFRATEGLLFIGYGLTDWLALEFEAAVINATLHTASNDLSSAPDSIHESGVGDVEGQIRARWQRESEHRPEVFSYFEWVAPIQKKKLLIGTPDWELKFGTGLIRGFTWGTLTVRAAAEYDRASTSKFDLGEYAVEYVRQVSRAWRVYAGIEGTQDEVQLLTEVQWHLTRSVILKLNSGFGLTSKATDWAPEVGILFSVPVGGRRND